MGVLTRIALALLCSVGAVASVMLLIAWKPPLAYSFLLGSLALFLLASASTAIFKPKNLVRLLGQLDDGKKGSERTQIQVLISHRGLDLGIAAYVSSLALLVLLTLLMGRQNLTLAMLTSLPLLLLGIVIHVWWAWLKIRRD